MGGDDERLETTGWETLEIPPEEAKRLQQRGGPAELSPIDVPDDLDDAKTETMEIGHYGDDLPERYVIRASLGPEGEGDLFKAFDEELEREVVLKILREDGGQRALDRLRDEARSVVRVAHPGAVTVYDIATLPNGRAYVVREVVEGRALDRWVHETEPRQRLQWLQTAIGTLAAAHHVGIAHLRLEPKHIHVGAVVKVTGFGIGEADPGPFMAPELVTGEGGDRRSDVYSLGRIALFVLGQDTPAGLLEVFERACSNEPWSRQHGADALLADLADLAG